MAEKQSAATCPACGNEVKPSALACPACGQEIVASYGIEKDAPDRPRRPRQRPLDDDDDQDDRPRRRRRRDITNPDDEALSWIVPMRESWWAIAAGYLGLFACFPFLGIVAAIFAIILGFVALKDIERNKGRRGAFRAWFGIIVGGLMLLAWGVLLLLALLPR